jgi:hypothetical protein
MPQILAFALIGAGLYAGYRWFSRLSAEIGSELERARDELQRRTSSGSNERDLGQLEYDPASGVYKPSKRT